MQFYLLGFSWLNMLMLDSPAGSDCDRIRGQWKGLEQFYELGHVKTVAVSNFNLEQLECIRKNRGSTLMPSVNQIKYSVGYGDSTLVADHGKYGIYVQAYSPLGGGDLVRLAGRGGGRA